MQLPFSLTLIHVCPHVWSCYRRHPPCLLFLSSSSLFLSALSLRVRCSLCKRGNLIIHSPPFSVTFSSSSSPPSSHRLLIWSIFTISYRTSPPQSVSCPFSCSTSTAKSCLFSLMYPALLPLCFSGSTHLHCTTSFSWLPPPPVRIREETVQGGRR